MAQSRQTPRVWSDAIRGSEILSNWVKLGTSAVLLWLSVGIVFGVVVAGFFFFDGTTSLDRRLWVHHVRNNVGMGGPLADLPAPNAASGRILVPKGQVQRYTRASYDRVNGRFQESLLWGFLVTATVAIVAGYLLRQSGHTATEDHHIRGATLGCPQSRVDPLG